jgi:hypothetical protein
MLTREGRRSLKFKTRQVLKPVCQALSYGVNGFNHLENVSRDASKSKRASALSEGSLQAFQEMR